MKRVLLLTGKPGTGKTSLIKAAIVGLKDAGGFYTEEIRSPETRLGFRLITLSGESGVLAHVKIKSPYRVGKYGVDISVLENLGVKAVSRAISESNLIVIDEIGKMELFSDQFREAVLRAVQSGKKVLATIMLSSNPFADALKRREEVDLVPVTRANNERVLGEIREWLKG
ncbi:MAG: NTPase [Chloroflexota bacterium]